MPGNIISAKRFQEFAGNDQNRWELLVNHIVQHKTLGTGVVRAVQPGAAPGLIIRFDRPTDGKLERIFASNVFGQFFADLDAPKAWLEMIEEDEQNLVKFKAEVLKTTVKPQIVSTTPKPGSARVRPTGNARKRKATRAEISQADETVKCPYCSFAYLNRDMAKHICDAHPSRYGSWRAKVDPEGNHTPAPRSFDKNVIVVRAGKTSDPSQQAHPVCKPVSRVSARKIPEEPIALPPAVEQPAPPRPVFRPGQKVIVKKDPKRRGVIAGEPYLAGGEFHYEVFMTSGSEETYRELNLADQAAKNILRRKQELEEFEQKRLQFMGQEAIFSSLLNQTIESGGFISDQEVYALVDSYLVSACNGRDLLESNGDGTFALNINDGLAARLSDFIHTHRRNDLTALDFIHNLTPGKVLPVTFMQRLAYERKLLHFITILHPLAQAALEYWKDRAEAANTLARLGLQTEAVRQGDYYVFVFVLNADGAEKSTRLVAVAVVPGENDVYVDLSNSFLRLVQTSHYDLAGPFPDLELDEMESAYSTAREYMAHRRDVIEAEIQRSNDALVNARLAALVQSYEAKRRRVEEALEVATDTRIRNMRRGQLRNLEARHRLRKDEIEAQRQVSVSFRLALKAYVTVDATHVPAKN